MADAKKTTTSKRELAALVEGVKWRLRSAENALARDDEEWIADEIARVRNMLRAWTGLKSLSEELDARMYFTYGVTFYAATTYPPVEAAEEIIGKVQLLAPDYANGIDSVSTALAVQKYRKNKRFDWDAMTAAWGRAYITAERWRADWKEKGSGRKRLN